MFFWELQRSNNIVAIDEKSSINFTYNMLQKEIDDISELLTNISNNKTLGIIVCKNEISSLIGYICALQTKNAAFLIHSGLNDSLFLNLLNRYKPEWLWIPNDFNISLLDYIELKTKYGYKLLKRRNLNDVIPINENLGILLTTSGTTGSPKTVRLSYNNLQHNAKSISEYMTITDSDIAITTLPMSYSYGLSIINSHLLSNSKILLTESKIISKHFWNLFISNNVTNFGGVPTSYQILKQVGFNKLNLPSLRFMTQAGGNLKDIYKRYFIDYVIKKNIKLYLMYGQTEATARISYLPPERILDKYNSIGRAIPGGKMEISGNKELIYYGPNVMMGYANSRDDLVKGDELYGRLETGDIATEDSEGFYYLLNRKNRFAKISGNRISLDELEHLIENQFKEPVFILERSSKIYIYHTSIAILENYIEKFMIETLKIHKTFFKVKYINEIPLLENGKVNYKTLELLSE